MSLLVCADTARMGRHLGHGQKLRIGGHTATSLQIVLLLRCTEVFSVQDDDQENGNHVKGYSTEL